ncbi:sugar ABC transporter ATP-binding protein [Rhizobium binae]|uniref:sugar ABC transporter ATP-binding protein n=1 Tax=Rhizobium binae TaxID=1138190 RepID=UPI001C83ED9E|nr:sugar ABC transporter ATP-binding protein [Rhizobium binae]MBX4927771.1 sugar ABC transporter ATP-binding protein [Rhizobium binae]MBX4937612.1 sugar ABC transporter ATP-binding protein [Rhizobium binae]MBX4944131.1 sugar ABC transporter ATP-binding protein [Rhizobium binae]MBX4952231.1 sugar ABC transporter ATP-binding protein [Rhizobium binae]MBX4963993.1 sugar ABC transporter ATP-binding protein [Rhizobium binae]
MTSALALAGITKSFPGVRALKGVSFSLEPGEIRALVGENGAGKSTLMKILSGAYSADEGRIELFGEEVLDPTPAGMIARGVAVIYQELAQAPHLTVAENVLMGRLPRKGALIDWGEAKRRTIEVVDRLGFDVDPTARIGTLSVAKRQMVEIAKALARDAKIIVLDEPSAVLAQAEIDQLFRVVKQLARESGVAFVYISHRLREVFELSDTVTVLRDGTVIHNGPSNGLTTDDLIRSMVGRDVGDVFPKRTPRIGEEALSAKGISTQALLRNVSIHVRKGEIVGLFGLAGAGRTELLRAIYGADPRDAGEVSINGAMTSIGSPRAGIIKGLGLVPEDRKTEGLFLIQSVGFNIMSASLAQIVRFGLLSLRREHKIVSVLIERLRIRTPNAAAATQNLSGGNQQKCVLARLVSAGCEILLADEPTRGVDVGAKREIYDLLVELAESRGLAIVMASSELPEILGLCDRLYVLREGEVTAELDARTATEEEVMHFAALH